MYEYLSVFSILKLKSNKLLDDKNEQVGRWVWIIKRNYILIK